MKGFGRWFLGLILGGCLLGAARPLVAAIEVDVSGIGWLRNARIANVIGEILSLEEEGRGPLSSFELEDALLILNGDLNGQGFLAPEIEVVLLAGSEVVAQFFWVAPEMPALPPLESVTRVEFRVEKGVRSYFEAVHFEGLEAIPEEEAARFFFPTNALFVGKGEKAYAPSILNRGLGALTAHFNGLGYLEAEVISERAEVDLETGAAEAWVRVREGPRYDWRKVNYELQGGGEAVPGVDLPVGGARSGVYTLAAQQDLAVNLRNRFLRAGYPDVRVTAERALTEEGENRVLADVRFRITPGPRVRLGEVTYVGLETTSRNFLTERSELEVGEWLDLLALDRARSRLGRLGIFDRIDVHFEPPEDPAERAVEFRVAEGLRREINLLLGYGSYEKVRAGAEMKFYNIFGRAHQAQIRLHQSLKTSAGRLTYSVPDLPWVLEQGQVRIQGMRREELSFTREEAVASVGIEHHFFKGEVRTTAQYSYQILRSIGLDSVEIIGDESARVGSITLGAAWDRRDRVIFPRNGFDLRGELELASPSLASEAYFQRFVWSTSFHRAFREDQIRFHFGLEQGILARWGADREELPFNKRFFPGGENSIRGYREGGASPRGPDGETLGSEVYLLGHAEVAFALTRSLGFVLFVDGLLQARELADFPGDTTLWSAGAGFRYETPLGPLRLEYGYNLTRREFDPAGTLHLSIGFPF